jgi:hypothetical protein
VRELKTAENAVKSAELEVQKADVVPPVTAEQNRLSLDEARAKASQVRHTYDLRRTLDAADIRALEIQRDRAENAWKHAESNADKMRVVCPALRMTGDSGVFGPFRVSGHRASRATRKSTTRSNGSKPNAAATDGRRFELALMS